MKVSILIPLCVFCIMASCNFPNVRIHQSNASYYEAIGALPNKEDKSQDDTTAFIIPREGAIYWKNPSFEENQSPNHSTVPLQWSTCDSWGSPPDLHSNQTTYFEVTQMSSDGDKFLGMVVRDDGTYEGITQELDDYLVAGQLYQFQVDLSLSYRLISLSRKTLKRQNFNKPATLRVSGGASFCDKGEVLYETVAIDHNDWKSYTIEFIPENNCKFLVLEAFYDEEKSISPYNGNLMLDNLSPIVKIEE